MKMSKLLPFLEKEEIDELVEKILNNEIDEGEINIIATLPFLEEDQVYQLFEGALHKKINVNPAGFLPFLDDEALSKTITLIENKEVDTIKMETILPFLETEHIKKIFKQSLDSIKKKQE